MKTLRLLLAAFFIFSLFVSTGVIYSGSWRLYKKEERTFFEKAKSDFQEKFSSFLISARDDLKASSMAGKLFYNIESDNFWVIFLGDGKKVVYGLNPSRKTITRKVFAVERRVDEKSFGGNILFFQVKSRINEKAWNLRIRAEIFSPPAGVEKVFFYYNLYPFK